MTASGTAGYGTELASSFDLASIGADRDQVARRLRVGRQSCTPPPSDRAGDAQRRGPAGPWHRVLARARGARPRGVGGDGHRQHLGSVGRRLSPGGRPAAPPRRRASSPSRSTSRARTWRGGARSSPTIPTCRPRSSPPPPGCGRPRWAKLSANTDRIVDVAAAVADAGAEAVTCINTMLGFAYDPETLRPSLAAGRRGPVGPRDPSDRRARRARRPRRAARPADRRGRGSGLGVGCGRDAARRRVGGAGRHRVVRRSGRTGRRFRRSCSLGHTGVAFAASIRSAR